MSRPQRMAKEAAKFKRDRITRIALSNKSRVWSVEETNQTLKHYKGKDLDYVFEEYISHIFPLILSYIIDGQSVNKVAKMIGIYDSKWLHNWLRYYPKLLRSVRECMALGKKRKMLNVLESPLDETDGAL